MRELFLVLDQKVSPLTFDRMVGEAAHGRLRLLAQHERSKPCSTAPMRHRPNLAGSPTTTVANANVPKDSNCVVTAQPFHHL